MGVKLVVADIDGTLYGESRILTDRTRNAINALREKGIMFGLASGRDIHNMRAYNQQWGFTSDFDAYIGMNGAMLYDHVNDTYQQDFVMTYEQLMMIENHILHFGLNCSYFADDGYVYLRHDDERTLKSRQRNKKVEKFDVLNDDLTLLEGKGIFKACYGIDPSRMPELEQFVAEHPFDEQFVGFKTQPMYYEVMLKGVNKGEGLKKFCASNNISLDEVVAFGDTTNDIEMLKCCYGVCLVDGSDDAKAVSKDITELKAEEDGMADYIEKHLL